jgi:cytochrome b6-f complex iron-sulfur subunit
MNRKEFLLLTGGSALLAACQKEGTPAPATAPRPTAVPIVYLRVDLTQELLTVGSSLQDAARLVLVRRIAAGNTAAAFQHFSLVCPHAGCLVAVQAGSAEFHCPCHGSKFNPDGSVLNGPAARPLGQHVLTVEDRELLIKSS